VENLSEIMASAAELATRSIVFLTSAQAQKFMCDVSRLLAHRFEAGNKVIVAGNGGSMCDAAHFAEELTGCFRSPRRALPALVLSDSGHLTCVANDFGYDCVFERGIEAYGKSGDIFFALSTSGNSPNIIRAIQAAKERGMTVVCFLGKGGGDLLNVGDFQLIVPACTTSDRIQEVHMAALHMIIEGVEALMFNLASSVQKAARTN